MAYGALGNVSGINRGIFFRTCFFLSNSFVFCAGGLLWLPWEHSKDISFQHNQLSSRERVVLYRILKTTSSSREKNEWHVRLGPSAVEWGAGQVKDAQLT